MVLSSVRIRLKNNFHAGADMVNDKRNEEIVVDGNPCAMKVAERFEYY